MISLLFQTLMALMRKMRINLQKKLIFFMEPQKGTHTLSAILELLVWLDSPSKIMAMLNRWFGFYWVSGVQDDL
jgi:hypothetical protein